MTRTTIFGASGYSGMLLAELAAAHPALELVCLAAHQAAGKSARAFGASPLLVRQATTFTSVEEALDKVQAGDLVFLATPAETSVALAEACAARGARVIDLSGAFRLEPAARRLAYPALPATTAKRSAYGLPELFRSSIGPATLRVANPGCYATAEALALAPLARLAAAPAHIAIHALSGVTGAGRSAREDLSFAELSEDARVYRVMTHQHAQEMQQTLALVDGSKVWPQVGFVPTLVPMRRGILLTATVALAAKASLDEVLGHYRAQYEGEPFVQVLPAPEDVRVRHVLGTNACHIGVAVQERTVVVVAALDNLLKGAAGQAIQNANLLLGLPETTGELRGL
jgi:N-acetyl-gamma-glutamyl-phosphate reductase